MINEFIEYLDAQVGRSLYVWGAQGQTDITEAWIRSRETSEANVQRVLALWKKLQAEGISPIAAYDCSGLIMHYLQDITGFYKTDLSAAGLYGKCTPVTRNALKKGDLVFRHNGTKIHHVGVYAGDGTAIESQGRDVGVTRRALDASGTGYWNRYGRLPLPDAPEPEKPEPAKTYFATVGGGSVYVRSGLSLALYLAALIPHAIFEIPAMLLAFGVGLYVCGQVTRRLRGNEQTRSITSCLSLMGQTLLLALAPLLLAAAFVEAYVTPAVAAWFL